jgi:hypothetical protein
MAQAALQSDVWVCRCAHRRAVTAAAARTVVGSLAVRQWPGGGSVGAVSTSGAETGPTWKQHGVGVVMAVGVLMGLGIGKGKKAVALGGSLPEKLLVARVHGCGGRPWLPTDGKLGRRSWAVA